MSNVVASHRERTYHERMAVLTTREKLAILSDAAKYDASCASSGAAKRDSLKSGGIGSTEGMGICHSYAPDGRCISLLKILLTNFCIYDCSYCINRSSSNVRRARFTVDEVVRLTMAFYKRNYIEGLFLSSGVIRSPDETMGEMVEVARRLRVDEKFGGYIHLKTIPECSAELLEQAGLYADRLSINVELPTDEGVKKLAPEKTPGNDPPVDGQPAQKIEEKAEPTLRTKKRQRFAPGWTIDADDRRRRRDRRRRHSAHQRAALRQLSSAPRLLFRFQPDSGFVLGAAAEEAAADARAPALPGRLADALLWLFPAGDSGRQAGRHARPRDRPEACLGAAQPRTLSRSMSTAPTRRCCCACPASAPRWSTASLQTRRYRRLRLEDVGRLCQSIAKVRPFIVAEGWSPGALTDKPGLREKIVQLLRAAFAVLTMQTALLDLLDSCRIGSTSETDFSGWRDAARRAGAE